MKEAVRRVYFWFVEAGLADAEIEAEAGTLKFKFLNWLYGNGEPIFDTQWPNNEDGEE